MLIACSRDVVFCESVFDSSLRLHYFDVVTVSTAVELRG